MMIHLSQKTFKSLFFVFALLFCSMLYSQQQKAPAYPLITHDPYFSIWSFTDQLNAEPTKHWTGTEQSLTGFIKVDGKVYRFMGKEGIEYDVVLPATEENNYSVKYTEAQPASGWNNLNFNDEVWKMGTAPFGDDKGYAKTIWQSRDLWVRRSFDYMGNDSKNVYLKIDHDDNIEVFLNGEKIYDYTGWVHKYKYVSIGGAQLKKGKNLLAIHIKNTAGGQHLDFGLVKEKLQPELQNVVKAEQKNVTIKATQTIYDFACGPVNLKATFTSPLVLNDLDLLARPVSYITFNTSSTDGKKHDVQVLLSASSGLAVNVPSQEVQATRYSSAGLSILKAGTTSQEVLQKKGDDLRIDWGYMYIAAPSGNNYAQYISRSGADALKVLNNSGIINSSENQIKGKQILLNTILKLGSAKAGTGKILVGYDDIYSIQYFGQNLRPWWNKDNNTTIEKQLQTANSDYNKIIKKCNEADKTIYTDAFNAGGEQYAKLCELAYRQAISAHKLVRSPQGELLFLSKENFSNGCINTVDVTYPSAPLFLAYNPELLKGMLNGIFYFSESGKYTKPFAAHDLGTYPMANGEVYEGGMPVEESGNMLVLTSAIAAVEGNADYAKKHWTTLTTWAEYLSKEGFDPANQLCTDDFAGHFARNANLSLKAIMGLEGYAVLGKMLGKNDVYEKYHAMTGGMVKGWMKLANGNDHYSLVFEKPETWSQKYNMVWDKVLNYNIFPQSVSQKEIKYYLDRQNEYGLPLDNRKTYTKSDWIMWVAVMTDNKKDFDAFVAPLYKYATTTTSRVPLGDWHETTNGKQVGFQARSVVGGYYMKVLEQKLRNSKLSAAR